MSAIDGASPSVMVSVAMITYNHERFIAQAIESVLMQETDFAVELVIGEDCSTDGTRAIVQEYARRYPGRIRPLLPEHNLGAMNNFAAVYNACRGKYIALCEGDDYWTDPLKLQKQVDYLERHSECTICFHDAYIIREDGTLLHQFPLTQSLKLVYDLEDLLDEDFICTASVMYRKGVVQDLPQWYFGMMMGDWPLHILHAEQGKIGYLNQTMAHYRFHGGGMWSGSPVHKRLRGQIALFEALKDHLGNRYQRKISHTLSTYYLWLASLLAGEDNPSQAKKYLVKSIVESPSNIFILRMDWTALYFRLYMPKVHRLIKALHSSDKNHNSVKMIAD